MRHLRSVGINIIIWLWDSIRILISQRIGDFSKMTLPCLKLEPLWNLGGAELVPEEFLKNTENIYNSCIISLVLQDLILSQRSNAIWTKLQPHTRSGFEMNNKFSADHGDANGRRHKRGGKYRNDHISCIYIIKTYI